MTAQHAGLTDIVLRAMVLFPESVKLHIAAFHTIVLLARPLGGKEGMLFHSSMVNSSGIFNKESKSGKSGIAVMLDSMRRFEYDEVVQAMSCWSLVNIALAPSQKAALVKLGGISVVMNSMIQHPYNAEVQFRALFALINLVIPCKFAMFQSYVPIYLFWFVLSHFLNFPFLQLSELLTKAVPMITKSSSVKLTTPLKETYWTRMWAKSPIW
jgi:hypothetical protein